MNKYVTILFCSCRLSQGSQQGEERQGDHEGDTSNHAPDSFLHHLLALSR